MRLLTISGSLRAVSSNTTLLDAVALVAPDDLHVTRYDGLAELPPFNPDLDVEPAHPAVARYRAALVAADAIVISSPEYAHGVPGALKNALDWVVGSGELIARPIAVLNPSPFSGFAYPQLVETLTVMSARVISEASITLRVSGRRLDARAIAADPELAGPLREALGVLARAATDGAGGDAR